MGATLQQQLDVEAKNMLSLKPNWDGYGADPISPNLLNAILADLRVPGSPYRHRPQIVPGGDGSLQFEQHLTDLTVEYCRNQNGGIWLYVQDRNSGEEQEFFGENATIEFHKLARSRLTLPQPPQEEKE